jgi:hypothetical protein
VGTAAAPAAAQTARAIETRVMVRVRTKDAKFLGSSMGGALVVIRRADTGEVLVSGLTRGGTGDTKRIMSDPRVRGAQLADPGTAGFEAKLELAEPTFVTVEAAGPMAQRQSITRATVQTWLLPGRHVLGDGIVLEIPGFAVNVGAPRLHEAFAREGGVARVPIAVNVVMMCGCPTSPGGMWDASKYEVRGLVKIEGRPAGEVVLAPGHATSGFEGVLEAREPGTYEVTLAVFDPATGNAGVDVVTFMVR